ncbi:MAG TPA: alkaline phosphatase family protein [Caulobacteraceae bacterium]
MFRRAALGFCALALTSLAAGCRAEPAAAPAASVPPYAHILVIVEENKNYEQIADPATAPQLAALAARYGAATEFFSEVHPSEANYVALLGGDTFGIHDDDWALCKPGKASSACLFALFPGYVDHTVHAPHLGDQLSAAGLSWKGYYEDLPAPGSLAFLGGDPKAAPEAPRLAFYAAKHSGFVNFASVQNDPRRSEHLVGFDALDADLAADALPNFALIVPNQCNEMHGLRGPDLPPGCDAGDIGALIVRGDKVAADLVRRIQATAAWRSPANFAIVITFDEGAGGARGGCCAVTPNAPSNYGGGHIPTIVITNHGPRGLKDPTPYNHYSLLRTMEDAFGIGVHLRHAADTDLGVVSMVPLFATPRP